MSGPDADLEIRMPEAGLESLSLGEVARLFECLEALTGQSLGLVATRDGSACYGCAASAPDELRTTLEGLASRMGPESPRPPRAAALRELRALCDVAERHGGTLELSPSGDGAEPWLRLGPDAYRRCAERFTVTGRTTLLVEVLDVGGEDGAGTRLRTVGDGELVRGTVALNEAVKLAQHLYERALVDGEVTWVRGQWGVLDLHVERVVPYRRRSLAEAREMLRSMGADRWDALADPAPTGARSTGG